MTSSGSQYDNSPILGYWHNSRKIANMDVVEWVPTSSEMMSFHIDKPLVFWRFQK